MIPALHTLLFAALTVAACGTQDDSTRKVEAAEPRETGRTPGKGAQLAEYVVAALEDSHGNLWFGTNGQGVARYEPSTSPGARGVLRYFSIEDGLIGDVVTDIDGEHLGKSMAPPVANDVLSYWLGLSGEA